MFLFNLFRKIIEQSEKKPSKEKKGKMGAVKILAFFARTLFEMGVVLALILFIPGLPPYVNFEAFQ